MSEPDRQLVEDYWSHHRLSVSGSRSDRLRAEAEMGPYFAVDQLIADGGKPAIELLVSLATAAEGQSAASSPPRRTC